MGQQHEHLAETAAALTHVILDDLEEDDPEQQHVGAVRRQRQVYSTHSKVMKGSDVIWDETTLDQFLIKPKKMFPKTRMSFAGLKKEKQRRDLIAYLKEATK